MMSPSGSASSGAPASAAPAVPAPASRFRLVPMRPRDPHEPGRTASTLELFFDLVFVVAVSNAASALHHALASGHVTMGIIDYLAVFFGIWWAWMNFTWFATSFDTDDWLYRVITIVQMGGVLVLASGIAPVFESQDFTVLFVAYVVMRLAMVAQWIRASRGQGQAQRAARIYAVGIPIVQVLWLVALLLPAPLFQICYVLLVGAEIAVPVIAERTGRTAWHPHHITERYGLFTLILLGESLLGSANAIIEALHERDELIHLLPIAALALIATAALWWIYFWPEHHDAIDSFGSSLAYGYGHYLIFAAAGAFSVGIELQIDVITGSTELPAGMVPFAFTIPLAVFMLGVWWVALRRHGDRWVNTTLPVTALLVLVSALVPTAFALTALILVLTVTMLVWRDPAPVTIEAADGPAGPVGASEQAR